MRSARSRASARRRWRRWSPSARRNGPFKSLDDFAERIDPRAAQPPPAGKPGRRRRVRRAQPGPRRRSMPRPRPSSPMPPAPHDQRTSGQHGLFGGGGDSGVAPIRLPRDARWTLAERMAAERDAFGFYFSAHPVDAQRHLLAAHKVRSFAELAALPLRPMAAGRSAIMAGLVEGARWRISAKGRRYLTATISDAIGQYEATAFDDEPCADAGSRGQVRRVRPDDRRARPPPGRRRAAGHRQALPAARQPGQANAAADDGADRRSSRWSRRLRANLAAAAAATASCAYRADLARAAKRRWSSAAISASTPTSPPASRGSPARARRPQRVRKPPRLALVG